MVSLSRGRFAQGRWYEIERYHIRINEEIGYWYDGPELAYRHDGLGERYE
jgi:hypothetical protein